MRLRLTSLLTLIFALVAIATAHSAAPGQNGLIAFSKGGVIYLVKTDRSDPVPLVFVGENGAPLMGETPQAVHPTWSPAGDRIAFTGYTTMGGEQNSDIYVVNADGSGLERRTYAPARDMAPSWSPDGSRIVFESDRVKKNQRDIYIMNSDGSELEPLAADGNAPSWSPAGDIIYFQRFDAANPDWNTYRVAPDGGMPQLVVGLADVSISMPIDWSHDSSRIAFATIVAGQGWHLFSAAPDGSDRKQLTRTRKPPTVGPIGGGGGVATRGLTLVAPLAANLNPTWSPDGTQIAFSTGSDFARRGMYVMNTKGANIRPIVTPALAGDRLSWQSLAPPEPTPVPVEEEQIQPVPGRDVAEPAPSRRTRCTINGTPGDDVLRGTPGRDVICGRGGNDVLIGRGGADILKGGAGDDTLKGNGGRDELRGGPGDDVLRGGRGRDRLFGQAGNDSLFSKDRVRDLLKGGKGRDTARTDGFDRARSIENNKR
ncbi:MAG: hypothetical protein ACR2OD_09170 [Gaiellaceae bacterium]